MNVRTQVMKSRLRAVVAVTSVGWPLAARADIGVPLVAVFLPPMWLALIPIILLEAALLARMLSASFGRALLPSTIGNVVTAIVGVPLTWLALAIAELVCCGTARGLGTIGAKAYAVTVQAPWLIPYEQDLGWMIPIALVVIAIPCLVVTVAVEGLVNRRFFPNEARQVWKATWLVNAASYAMLGLLMVPAWAVAGRLESLFNPVSEWFIEVTFRIAKLFVGAN